MNVLFVYSDVGYTLPKVTIALIYLSVSELTSRLSLYNHWTGLVEWHFFPLKFSRSLYYACLYAMVVWSIIII